MSLLRYMKPVGGLPDTRESLSSAIPSQEIAAANKEVQKESESAATRAKRGPYKKYSAALRLEIAKHASQHGAAATVRYYFCYLCDTTRYYLYSLSLWPLLRTKVGKESLVLLVVSQKSTVFYQLRNSESLLSF